MNGVLHIKFNANIQFLKECCGPEMFNTIKCAAKPYNNPIIYLSRKEHTFLYSNEKVKREERRTHSSQEPKRIHLRKDK